MIKQLLHEVKIIAQNTERSSFQVQDFQQLIYIRL